MSQVARTWWSRLGDGVRGLTGPRTLGGGFEGSRYLGKWLLLGVTVGLVAGVGAIIFYWALGLATHLFLGDIVGYVPPEPVGEGEPMRHAIAHPWLLPLVTALGGLVSGLIVFTLAPEAEGHGTDAAITAIHHQAGRLRGRIPPIKLVASAMTIGSGGSGGREGPAAQISAGFGSLLGQWLKLDAQDRRILVAAGMGAGIGAIFRAPLGGAVMAAEILYIHDLEVEALIPSLIAAIVGYSVFGSVEGFTPIFGAQPELGFEHPLTLGYYAVLGICCGLVGLLYARSFYGTARVFHHLRLPRWLKPALGGLLVGLLGLAVHGALHTGYGWVQISMTDELLTLPLWLVLVLPFAKILATSLSIGSGGSGGIFGPGMVIGGMLGATFWRLGHGVLPQLPGSPAPFVIIGMMALFGGVAHAPLAVMLMVAEMTGNLSLLAPAMVAIALATLVVGDTTIYASQLPNRAAAPAHRMRFSFPLLSALLVRDALVASEPPMAAERTLAEAEPLLAARPGVPLPVLDAQQRGIGLVTDGQVQSVPLDDRGIRALRTVMTTDVPTLGPGQALDVALEQLAESGQQWAAVVDEGRFVGWLNTRHALTAYRSALGRSVRRARALPEAARLFEVRVGTDSPIAGRTLRRAALPRETLVVSVTRDGVLLFPTAETALLPGDLVLLLTEEDREADLRAFLEGGPVVP